MPPEVTDLDLELTPVPALENTGKPTITGTSKVDDVLTASTGEWSLDGLDFAYQWLRNGGVIDGATASTYTVTPADVDAAITVRVTASKAGFDDVSAVSDPITGQLGTATQNTGVPTITGTPRVDEVLSAGTGTWSRSGLTFGYHWLRNGTAIDGATSSSYTVVPADVDQPISVRVTASKTGYANGTATSSAVTGQLGTASENSVLPGITGTPKVDEQLMAGPGTWSRSGLSFAYQWLRNGTAIDGATGATYTVVPADVDQPISVRVTASKAGYQDGVAVSPAVTGALGAASQNTAPPTISGVARAAETLTANPGTWNRGGLGFAYQWLRDGVAIDGADDVTYVLTKADVDASITVRVTASKTGYVDGVADSAAVVPDVSQACTDAQSDLASATAAAAAALKAYNAAKAKSAKAAKKVAAAAKKYKKNKTAKNKKKLVAAKKALKAAKKAEASAKKASSQAAAAQAAAQAAVDEAC